MSEHTSEAEGAPKDPKELMREALERKKSAARFDAEGAAGGSKIAGPHAKAAGKRQFRRKSGG